MEWSEFCVLLGGIMPDTPLGQVIEIRSEENKEMLKLYSPTQRAIRNEWRSRMARDMQKGKTEDDMDKLMGSIEKMFARNFGQ